MPGVTNEHEGVNEQARQLAKAVDELFQTRRHRPALLEWQQEFEREMESWEQRLEGAKRGKLKIGEFIEKYVPTPWDSENPSLATQAMVLAFFHDTYYERGAKVLGDPKDDSKYMRAFRKAYRFEDSEAYMGLADVDTPPSPPDYGRDCLGIIETYLNPVRAHLDGQAPKPPKLQPKAEARRKPKDTCWRGTSPAWKDIEGVVTADKNGHVWLQLWHKKGAHCQARHLLRTSHGCKEADFYHEMTDNQERRSDLLPEMTAERFSADFMNAKRTREGDPQRCSMQRRVRAWAKALSDLGMPAKGVYVERETVRLAFGLRKPRGEKQISSRIIREKDRKDSLAYTDTGAVGLRKADR